MNIRLLASCAILAFVNLSAPGFAQNSSDTQAGSTDETSATGPDADAIIVTARRRSEDLSTVPVSVSAFSSADIERKAIRTTFDLTRVTPGLNIGGSGTMANPVIAIRGQSRGLAGPGTPGVLTYFNEVPLPSYGSLISTFDMDNIQVLKGPQGTLFGRNAIGGAVLTYSRKPTYEFEGYAEAEYGSFNSLRLEGALNLPIVDGAVSLRIAGQSTSTDGYTDTFVYSPYTLAPTGTAAPGSLISNARDYDEFDNKGLRASLLIEPSDNVSSLTVVDYYRLRGNANIVFTGLFPGTAPVYALPAETLDAIGLGGLLNPTFHCGTSPSCDIDEAIDYAKNNRRSAFTNMDPNGLTEIFGITNTTSVDFGFATLKNIFGYRKSDDDHNTDIDGSALAIVDVVDTVRLYQITEELQLSGEALDDKLQFVIGGFYYKSAPDGLGGREADGISVFNGLSVSTTANYQRETSKAIYGQFDYDLSALIGGLEVTAGYRYSWDKTKGCAYSADYSIPAGGTPPRIGEFGFLPDEDQCVTGDFTPDPDAAITIAENFLQESEKGTYTLGLSWQATPDLLLYATTRRGYRPGGYNVPQLDPAVANLQNFEPETLTDVEIGTKGRYSVGAIDGSFSLAAFRGKDDGYQYYQNTTGVSILPAGGILLNKADLIIKGVEGNFSIRPVRGLTFGSNFAYTDVKVDELTVPQSLVDIYDAAGVGPSLLVTSVFFQPKWQVNGNVEYAVPGEILGGYVIANLDFHYQSSYQAGEVRVDDYETADLRVSLTELYDDRVDISFAVRNVFDELYQNGVSSSSAGTGAISYLFAAPRTFSGSVRYRF